MSAHQESDVSAGTARCRSRRRPGGAHQPILADSRRAAVSGPSRRRTGATGVGDPGSGCHGCQRRARPAVPPVRPRDRTGDGQRKPMVRCRGSGRCRRHRHRVHCLARCSPTRARSHDGLDRSANRRAWSVGRAGDSSRDNRRRVDRSPPAPPRSRRGRIGVIGGALRYIADGSSASPVVTFGLPILAVVLSPLTSAPATPSGWVCVTSADSAASAAARCGSSAK